MPFWVKEWLQEGGWLGGDEAQTTKAEGQERAVKWAGLDRAVLKYQAEGPETMGSRGGHASSGGAQSRFMPQKSI